MDASWLQVDKACAASAKRRKQQQQKAAAEVSSDAGLTASATGDESHSERGQSNSMQALAGKLGHVQPKAQFDDTLPPEPTISRVMRVESAPDDHLLHSTDADAEEEGRGFIRRHHVQHKKEQERAGKIEEMRKKELSAPEGGKEARISGGMKTVVKDGKLIWE
ncbi:hypothetical protein FRC04_004930 [Tulasnella sp. 424]|nr:hypothetical protein FRC04_004930 [Tulasnella sp. 424]KAG8973463.1 hypothetical protein FRC05_008737 [Tulasnella sp. 425]